MWIRLLRKPDFGCHPRVFRYFWHWGKLYTASSRGLLTIQKVIVGYTATAGLTVAIITGYYFVAHQSELDPFRRENPQDVQTAQTPYTPHPVDKLVLNGVQQLKRTILKSKSATPVTEPTKRNTRLEKALLKVGSIASLTHLLLT